MAGSEIDSLRSTNDEGRITNEDETLTSQPDSPVDPKDLSPWRRYALEYLREQLREAAPSELGEATFFERSPLEGEGATVLFEFRAQRGAAESDRYYVAVGQTGPNYYPAYGLDADEAYSLHLGTRFMLAMGVAQCEPPGGAAYDPMPAARIVVDRVAPSAPIEGLSVAACFDVGGERHLVLRGKVAGQEVYIMAGDAPAGFSHRIELPPPVAYRLHLGAVLRSEATPKD
jgi:hypothetical protein